MVPDINCDLESADGSNNNNRLSSSVLPPVDNPVVVSIASSVNINDSGIISFHARVAESAQFRTRSLLLSDIYECQLNSERNSFHKQCKHRKI